MADTQINLRTVRTAQRPRPSGCLAGVFNLLTLLVLIVTCIGGLLFATLFTFPRVLRFVPGASVIMPATVPPLALVLVTPSPAPSPAPISTDSSGQPIYPTLPPIWTPTDTPTITPTPPPASETPISSGTPPFATATATHTATAKATSTGPTPTATGTRSHFNYTLQPGSPAYVTNFVNTAGCKWFGVVGRAFDTAGDPVINLTVHLVGGGLDVDALTGSSSGAIGPGGYQIPIADHPIETTNTYHIELRNNTGTPLSEVYTVPTFGVCDKNAVIFNFVQNH